MQLTSFTDYALRTLIYLGLQPNDRLVSVNEICEHFNMSRNHVIKVTQQLSQKEYIASARGRQGGIRLSRSVDTINIGQVIRDFEKRLTPIDCEGGECPIVHRCTLQQILAKAQTAFLAELDAYLLSDVIKNPAPLIALLKIEA
ncbi:Rrf2 family transcriptional regulator [Echinimonas agarilytica]|uniref:Rrf2 family transcriptional regulator n=1 Tax=Echinimonas agarilytica TaxID=1215918 RepID=A0AA42B730_9GAMM|nr:Rrf2 family transcriptional regulator [Echinimonas agarilytica]MCM2679434.1 Rrf2 family transcriptional regulator [Echinimonas agarilytica]